VECIRLTNGVGLPSLKDAEGSRAQRCFPLGELVGNKGRMRSPQGRLE
jgi:hypothetical protein